MVNKYGLSDATDPLDDDEMDPEDAVMVGFIEAYEPDLDDFEMTFLDTPVVSGGDDLMEPLPDTDEEPPETDPFDDPDLTEDDTGGSEGDFS